MSRDSDTAETFRAFREHGKEKREHNRNWSADHLEASGIPYVTKNDGAHLIIADRWDFWPGTGRWIDRTTKTKHTNRGIRSLIAVIKKA